MIFWIVYILSEVAIQDYYINKGFKPNYLLLFFIRGIFAIIQAILLQAYDTFEIITLLGWQTCSFWIIFDLALNKIRGKPWNYKGKTSGWLDKMDEPEYWACKWMALCMMIFFYFYGIDNYWSI